MNVPYELRKAWTDNPIAVLGVAAAMVASTAKLIDATSAAKGRRAYAKQVDYRIKKGSRK